MKRTAIGILSVIFMVSACEHNRSSENINVVVPKWTSSIEQYALKIEFAEPSVHNKQ